MWASLLTTGENLIVNTQKEMKKETKHNTTESYQDTREESKRSRKKQRGTTKQSENNEQNCNKYIPVNNYSKCKWTKFSNQKTQNGWIDTKTKPIYILPTRDSLQKWGHTDWKWMDRKRYSMQMEIKESCSSYTHIRQNRL